MKKLSFPLILCIGLAYPGGVGAQEQETQQSAQGTEGSSTGAQAPDAGAQKANVGAAESDAASGSAANVAPNKTDADSKITVPAKKPESAISTSRKHHQFKKSSGSGYDYEHSRYLSRSSEHNIYLFNAEGEPVSSEKSKTKASGEESSSDAGLALGSALPKQKLQRIDMSGHRMDSEQSGDANAAGQIPPGMLPPGMNLGNLMKQGGSGK